MRKQHIAFALVGTLALGIVGCAQQQQAPQQQEEAQQEATQQEASQSDLISSEEAIKIAKEYIAGDNLVSEVTCDLPDGSSEPRYVVQFRYDDAVYTVKLGARDGDVWYATATYNDGTSVDVTKDKDAEHAEPQQEEAEPAEK